MISSNRASVVYIDGCWGCPNLLRTQKGPEYWAVFFFLVVGRRWAPTQAVSCSSLLLCGKEACFLIGWDLVLGDVACGISLGSIDGILLGLLNNRLTEFHLDLLRSLLGLLDGSVTEFHLDPSAEFRLGCAIDCSLISYLDCLRLAAVAAAPLPLLLASLRWCCHLLPFVALPPSLSLAPLLALPMPPSCCCLCCCCRCCVLLAPLRLHCRLHRRRCFHWSCSLH